MKMECAQSAEQNRKMCKVSALTVAVKDEQQQKEININIYKIIEKQPQQK